MPTQASRRSCLLVACELWAKQGPAKYTSTALHDASSGMQHLRSLGTEGHSHVLQVAQQVTLANDLQKNQRVAVRRKHVIEVKFANDDED